MFHEYKIVLVLAMFVFAYLILGWRNRFDRAAITSLRFFVAVIFLWFYFIVSRMIVLDMDMELAASAEERAAIYESDGAANLGVVLFGWIPGILVATSVWAWVRAWRWLRARVSRRK